MTLQNKDDSSVGRTVPPFASSHVPLYYQLATILREKIVTGLYVMDDKFPTEAELVKNYGVSRITVRQALNILEKEELIRREAGKGTFVTGYPIFKGALQMDGTLNGLIAMGLATTPTLLEVREVKVAAQEAEAIGIEAGTRIVRAKRVRYCDGKPYCFIINHIPVEIGRRIPEERWSKGSLLQFMERQLGIELGDADERVRATLADAHLARWLEVRIGAPLLHVEYEIHAADGSPVQTAVIYYRSDSYTFLLKLTRASVRPVAPNGWELRSE